MISFLIRLRLAKHSITVSHNRRLSANIVNIIVAKSRVAPSSKNSRQCIAQHRISCLPNMNRMQRINARVLNNRADRFVSFQKPILGTKLLNRLQRQAGKLGVVYVEVYVSTNRRYFLNEGTLAFAHSFDQVLSQNSRFLVEFFRQFKR